MVKDDRVRREARSIIAIYGPDALNVARRTEANLRSAGHQRAAIWAGIVEAIIAAEQAVRSR
jgi:hypothetical protein